RSALVGTHRRPASPTSPRRAAVVTRRDTDLIPVAYPTVEEQPAPAHPNVPHATRSQRCHSNPTAVVPAGPTEPRDSPWPPSAPSLPARPAPSSTGCWTTCQSATDTPRTTALRGQPLRAPLDRLPHAQRTPDIRAHDFDM